MCHSSKTSIILLVIGALVAGWYGYIYHSPHLAALLPFLFILACPLMHLFMMRGDKSHTQTNDTNQKKSCH